MRRRPPPQIVPGAARLKSPEIALPCHPPSMSTSETPSVKWFHYALLGASTLGVITALGYFFGAPSRLPRRQRGAHGTALDEVDEVEDPKVEARIIAAHRRAGEARNSRAGNWAHVASDAATEAIALMEKSPKYKHSLQLAEMHFIRFEIYAGEGEAFWQMAEHHLQAYVNIPFSVFLVRRGRN